jgi:mono/diheme cytochrome c family protein
LSQDQIAIIRRWIVADATDSSCAGGNEPTCDTSTVTYSGSIRPILAAECVSCHSVAADTNLNVDLSTFDGVKSVAESGQLYGSITHAPGYAPMPHDNDTLSDCQILLIRTWIDEGASNN